MKKPISLLFFAFVLITCEEFREVVFVDTMDATGITSQSATLNGTIVDPGEGIAECGHIWWKSGNENTTTKITLTTIKTGDYSCLLSGLEPSTLYYIKAYATDGGEPVYGATLSFLTLDQQTAAGLPVVVTKPVTAITATTAQSGGTVSDDGGAPVTARGVCWNLSPDPTLSNPHTNHGTGTGEFTSTLSGLTPNTTYYLRAYATNSAGTAYGSSFVFATEKDNPTPACTIPANVDAAFYRLPAGTSITIDGIEESAWNEVPAQNIDKNYVGEYPSVTAYWKGLWDDQYIYVLVDVQDDDHWPSWESGGNSWDYDRIELFFDLNDELTDGIGPSTADMGHWQCAPTLTESCYNTESFDAGWAQHCVDSYFSYGLTGENYVTEIKIPIQHMYDKYLVPLNTDDLAVKTVGFDVHVVDIDEGISSVRARKVWRSDGNGDPIGAWDNMDDCGRAIFCGSQGGTAALPSVTTSPVTDITSNTAMGWGNVTSDGGSDITSRGICWNINPGPTLADFSVNCGAGTGSFSGEMTGLMPNTNYYARSFATNSNGVTYGNEVGFTTSGSSANTFTDARDGHVYAWVQIGNQVWMAENLAYLPAVSPPSVYSFTTPYYYVYDYSGNSVSAAKATSNYTEYGVLYNWPAAMNGASGSISVPSGVQGVCPSGWHLPSWAEFEVLINYAGGGTTAGGGLKESGTAHWEIPDTAASNSTGFTARPGGLLLVDAFGNDFFNLGTIGYWWSTSEFSYEEYVDYVSLLGLETGKKEVVHYVAPRNWSHSVRCVKD